MNRNARRLSNPPAAHRWSSGHNTQKKLRKSFLRPHNSARRTMENCQIFHWLNSEGNAPGCSSVRLDLFWVISKRGKKIATSTGWQYWILLRKCNYYVSCLRDVFLISLIHLPNIIKNSFISGIESCVITRYKYDQNSRPPLCKSARARRHKCNFVSDWSWRLVVLLHCSSTEERDMQPSYCHITQVHLESILTRNGKKSGP